MSDNPYKTLGVEPDAPDKEIKAAYRRLAKSLHPDLNPGKDTEDRFKAVSAAYGLLKDKDLRARFDRGEIDASGAETQQNPSYRSYAEADGSHHYHHTGGFSDFASENDFFEQLFGQAFQQNRNSTNSRRSGKEPNVQYKLAISFLNAALGTKQRLTMPDGTSLDVTIPVGVSDGQTIRLKGKEIPGQAEARSEDVHIKITVSPHPYFNRQHDNIELELPVTIDEAILGGKINVPTIHGAVTMNIPSGAKNGQTLRLKNKGIKSAKAAKSGDQLITLKVILPEKPDEELTEFMRSWREKHPYSVRQAYEGGQ